MTEESVAVWPDAEHALDPNHVRRVCHDLKQSIATGLLLTDTIGSEEVDPGTHRRVEVLHQQLQQAAELVSLLSGQEVARPETADLAEVTRESVTWASAVHRVRLEVVGEEHLVHGDPVLLRRAVLNLLDNACRAAGKDGEVRVAVSRVGSDIAVEILDTGPGFGAIAAGTGVGLDIVRSAVWAGGGRLRVETGPGSGTSVLMSFPAALRVVR